MSRAIESRADLGRQQWRQLTWITLGAIAVFIGLRLLPTGTNLSHMDFRVDPKSGAAIEFCDPSNPQFIPVLAVRSPVVMTVATAGPAQSGTTVRATVRLETASGKAIAPADLLYTHTRQLHLLLFDRTLSDYQHVHPEAGNPGEWHFQFAPRRDGTYRVFADFTPAATGRGLYGSADLEVMSARQGADSVQPEVPALDISEVGGRAHVRDGHRFTLTTLQPPRAGQPIDLRFTIESEDGKEVVLEPVMDAFAHLVAIDVARTGFAHLHPVGVQAAMPASASRRELDFKLTIPKPGRYVVWAQVNLAGRETFVPFAVTVM